MRGSSGPGPVHALTIVDVRASVQEAHPLYARHVQAVSHRSFLEDMCRWVIVAVVAVVAANKPTLCARHLDHLSQ